MEEEGGEGSYAPSQVLFCPSRSSSPPFTFVVASSSASEQAQAQQMAAHSPAEA